MNRRHFVKLSGTAAAGLIFSRLTTYANEAHLINAPDKVWANANGQWFPLIYSNGIFSYQNINVKFKEEEKAISVMVSSPGLALSAVKLSWKYENNHKLNLLGDKWERSYGDLKWTKNTVANNNPWYLLINDEHSTFCFGVKTGASAFCAWSLKQNDLELHIDTQSGGNGVNLGSRELKAAEIVTMKNKPGESRFTTAQRFCSLMCPVTRLPKKPVYGINDWYFAYGNNSADLIKKITSLLTELAPDTDNRPFSVIDAGWATYSPFLPGDGGFMDDFSRPNDKFKDMAIMADDIKKLGMQPGLWTRVLCAKHDDPKTLLLPTIPGRDDPKQPILDPTIPENTERIKRTIALYRQWGYNLVKHDYTTYDLMGKWGFQMNDGLTAPGWNFQNNTKTTAEVMNELYSAIRSAAGDMYIIGCNTVSHLSAGVFELNRIGDDTSGKEWERTRKMGVNTLGFRIVQHNSFYATDADCVGLTNDIPWDKNKQWLQLLAESGTPLFISPQPDALGKLQKQAIKLAYSQAAKVQPIGEPLDWETNSQPAKWKLNGREVNFNW